VGVAVVVVAGGPVEGCMVVGSGLPYGRKWWGWCGRDWVPSVGDGGGRGFSPAIVGIGGCREFVAVVVVVGEGPSFGGVDRRGGGVWSGHVWVAGS